jgi:hypothetical protein
MIGNCAEIFYARGGCWSFYTAKTQGGHRVRSIRTNRLCQASSTGRRRYPVAKGCPFWDCHPAPGLGRLVSATMLVPLSSHSPIAPVVF